MSEMILAGDEKRNPFGALHLQMAEGFLFETTDESGLTVKTLDFDIFYRLGVMDDFVERVLKREPSRFLRSSRPSRKVKESSERVFYSSDVPELQGLPTQDEVRGLLKNTRYSENVYLFYRCVEQLEAKYGKFVFSVLNRHLPEGLIEELFQLIKEEGKDSEFRAKKHERLAKAKNNHASLKSYIDHLFERYGKLLVVRIDLGYLAKVRESLTLNIVRDDFKRLLNNRRRNRKFKDLVGYAWGLDWGPEKGGYHYHCLFFFNGEKAQQGITWGNVIGQYWADRITEGRGRFHNCNMQFYAHRGIGKISYFDTEARSNLLGRPAEYITKKELFFELLPDGEVSRDFKVFSHGEIPVLKSKPGPKRKRAFVESTRQR